MRPVAAAAALFLPLALAGCTLSTTSGPTISNAAALHGNVHGGQQPIVGAHVYLFAASTTGYGQPSVSLLNPLITHNADTLGAYVLTDANGSFLITGDYVCTPNTQVYLYALGGNPGAGNNSASGLLAALGNCPALGTFATAIPYIWVNEVSTVAAAYAFSGFATDSTHVSSSGSTAAQQGIANAFANAANLANIATGNALSVTPAGNGTVPLAEIDTLANILAACVNSTGAVTPPVIGPPATPGSSCYTLFNNAQSLGSSGTLPTETATAAIDIAHNPAANLASLFALSSSNAPFAPALSAKPNDFTIAISLAGIAGGGPLGGALDAHGNFWTADYKKTALVEYGPSGAMLSPPGGFTGNGLRTPYLVSFDTSGDVFVLNSFAGGTISEFTGAGAPFPGSPYTVGSNTLGAPSGIAIDASGDAWVASTTNAIIELTPSGTPVPGSPFSDGSQAGLNAADAIDAAGNVWVAVNTASNLSGSGFLVKLSSAGVPAPGSPFTGGGIDRPNSVAIGTGGNVWLTNCNNNSLSLFSNAGAALSPNTGFTGGGMNCPDLVAIDGAGNVWLTNDLGGSISEISPAGQPLSPATGFTAGGLFNFPYGIGIDGSGNVWVSEYTNNVVVEVIGAATPVVTPLAVGIKNNTLATRP